MDWKRGPLIGRGSTATVSLATSSSSGDLFAVKSSHLSTSASLQNEQFFLSKLNSPYVVNYIGHQITEENGRPIYNICLEYASGRTLRDAISGCGGRLDEAAIRSYTRSIVQGLDYLHFSGLAHCDIKSQNILITKDGAKIADFGCARLADGAANFSGTPAFMAPEVARGEEQGLPADVWALGCTVIEMATGKIPWAEYTDDPISALFKIGFSGEGPRIPAWLSEEGKDFLSKCLKRDPKERWTARELVDHPFVDVKEIPMSSPNCVLDQDFWDSMDDWESCNRNFESENLSNGNSAAERMKKLTGFGVRPEWDSGEGWITVRRGETMKEKDEISVDTDEVSSEFLVLDSVDFEEDFGRLSEDLLMDDVEIDFVEDENRSGENDFSSIYGFDFEIVLFTSISFCLLTLMFGYSVSSLIFWLNNNMWVIITNHLQLAIVLRNKIESKFYHSRMLRDRQTSNFTEVIEQSQPNYNTT